MALGVHSLQHTEFILLPRSCFHLKFLGLGEIKHEVSSVGLDDTSLETHKAEVVRPIFRFSQRVETYLNKSLQVVCDQFSTRNVFHII